MSTVRSMVREIQVELREEPDLLPGRAAELLNRLTGLLGNVLEEMRISDINYKRIYLAALNAHGKANRARIEAETSGEYQRKREAEDTGELCMEMIRSLRAVLKVKEAELRLAR